MGILFQLYRTPVVVQEYHAFDVLHTYMHVVPVQAGVMTAKGGTQKGSHLQEAIFVEFSRVGAGCWGATLPLPATDCMQYVQVS
jgi:hypothetical protein